MSEPRTARNPFGLPLWAWVVGSLLLVLATLYGSLWLPEWRERMAVRYLESLPECEIEAFSIGAHRSPPELPFVPKYEWLQWLHRFAPPHVKYQEVTIRRGFPLAELRRLTALRNWSFDAAGTEFGDEQMRHVLAAERLVLDETKVTDAGLEQLKDHQVGDLSVANTRVSDAGLLALTHLGSMYALDLSGTRAGRGVLERLAREAPAGRLQWLGLARTSTGDADMDFIAKLVDLWHLDLSDTGITDVGLARLATMSGSDIEVLILDRTQIGDEGLRTLHAQRSLEPFATLSLSGTRVTWEYIETWHKAPEELCLAGLDIRDRCANWFVERGEDLQTLDLSDTRLTDIGLAALEPCCMLRKLCVKNCDITEAAAIHFMESRPDSPGPRYAWHGGGLSPLSDRIQEYRRAGWLER
jgi:hypothetical protein